MSHPLRAALLVAAAAVAAACRSPASPPAADPLDGALAVESREGEVVQLKGTLPLIDETRSGGGAADKRFVLRYPASGWNGSLVLGAHGGSGGDNFDPTGKVIGTDETALDDVIGRHAVGSGFAYASVDRDGAMSAQAGLLLTGRFRETAVAALRHRLGRAPERIYLLGLSMGGGIARAAAETANSGYAGIVIVAGANGDLPTRAARQARLAELWPAIDPKDNPGLADSDPRVTAFAEAIGTPVAARRLWPYTAAGAVRAASASASARPAATAGSNSSGLVQVPTIEVAGTWDDFVIAELRAYRARVSPPDRHRLYLVEGVWHMSGDDDGVQSFMYIASRMGLGPDVATAMSEGPSYLPTVREAFDRLVAWVERGQAPPPSQTVEPGQPLQE